MSFLKLRLLKKKFEGKVEVFHIPPAPYTGTAFPITNIPYGSGTFVTTDGTYADTSLSPKVYTFHYSHSCCCTFYVFGEMYEDMYPSS